MSAGIVPDPRVRLVRSPSGLSRVQVRDDDLRVIGQARMDVLLTEFGLTPADLGPPRLSTTRPHTWTIPVLRNE